MSNEATYEEEIAKLTRLLKESDAKLEAAEKFNRDMVAKAASGGTLDGYREMGQKLADYEAKLEAAEAENTRLRVEVTALRTCDCPLPWHYATCMYRKSQERE